MAEAAEVVEVCWQGDNGSLPPPYRRSTEIEIDADGRGRLVRLHGYDRTDPAQRFEYAFAIDRARLAAFAARLQELAVWSTRWRERARVPVGGPCVHLRFRRGRREVRLPVFPTSGQQQAVERLRAEVLALLPAEAIAARDAWESTRGAGD